MTLSGLLTIMAFTKLVQNPIIFIDKSYEMVKNIIALFCLQFKKNLMNGKYIEQHKDAGKICSNLQPEIRIKECWPEVETSPWSW